ncbi:sigma-70 family RNA polymerase sigma factor [Olivibacter sp. CPCC 100613]|uniref:RNA polymerase sigma factor n=1 Tax=Olivibacter sp. CPCC 100613 TaxID=3079931 RepID=UPI002FFA2203
MQPVRKIGETNLIEGLRGGDTEAFEQLFDLHWDDLYRRAYYRVRNREVAEDLVQDVFADLWTQRHGLQIRDNLASYLGGILKYKIIYWASQHEREEKLHTYLFHRMEEIENTIIDLMEEASLQQTIAEVVQAFPENMRKIFLLRTQDYTVAEIAIALQLADQTIRNNHTEALRRLKSKLVEAYPHLPIYVLLTLLFTKT